LVKRAVDSGLVDSRPALDDRRGRLLTLTAEGRSRLLRAFQSLEADRAALAATFAELDARFRAASAAGKTHRR
jgi:DNA-binding MarR family transcriptional regulator